MFINKPTPRYEYWVYDKVSQQQSYKTAANAAHTKLSGDQ